MEGGKVLERVHQSTCPITCSFSSGAQGCSNMPKASGCFLVCGFWWRCSELYLLGAPLPARSCWKVSSEMSWLLQRKLVLKSCDQVIEQSLSCSPYSLAETTAHLMWLDTYIGIFSSCLCRCSRTVPALRPGIYCMATGGWSRGRAFSAWCCGTGLEHVHALFIEFRNGCSRPEDCWARCRGVGFTLKLCQLTSEAFLPLSQPKWAEANLLSFSFLPFVPAPQRRGMG